MQPTLVGRIPRFTHQGVHEADISVHPFATDDGLGLSLTRFRRSDCDDVVLLIHGLTLASDMFIMPEHYNLVNYLMDNGFGEVWTLDFRLSGRYPYNSETQRFSLDDAALFDHPAALRELRRHIGDRRLHVVSHCLGSLSFAMSICGGLLDGVRSLVCNSVALTPRVPFWSRVKLTLGPPLTEYVLGLHFGDVHYGNAPAFSRGWMLSRLVSLFHSECDSRACHMLSFMWGGGRPVYLHENLEEATHERIADLFGTCNVHYYRHINKMVRSGRAVKYRSGASHHADLPDDYLAHASRLTTPTLLLTGDQNYVFADSNIVCHRELEKATPGLHELEVISGYGHQDMFMGKNSHVDVFPRLLDFIKRHSR